MGNVDKSSDVKLQDGDVLFSWSGSLEVELWCGGPGASPRGAPARALLDVDGRQGGQEEGCVQLLSGLGVRNCVCCAGDRPLLRGVGVPSHLASSLGRAANADGEA